MRAFIGVYTQIAKPVGVIGALSPSTNPEATPVIKAIASVKGRNSVVIAPHPRAKKTNKLIVDLMCVWLARCLGDGVWWRVVSDAAVALFGGASHVCGLSLIHI